LSGNLKGTSSSNYIQQKEWNNKILQATNALVSLMNDSDKVQSIANPSKSGVTKYVPKETLSKGKYMLEALDLYAAEACHAKGRAQAA
jgi:hypothetical protein